MIRLRNHPASSSSFAGILRGSFFIKNAKKNPSQDFSHDGLCGRSGGTRTRDLLNPIQARYHLRYTPTVCSCFLSRTQDLFYCINRPLSRTFSNKSEFERKIKIIFHLDENCPEITCRMFCHSLSKIEARMEWSAGKSVRGLPRTGLEEIGFGVPRHARL